MSSPMTDKEILALQRSSEYIAMSSMVQDTRKFPKIPQYCSWCGVEAKDADMYRCEEDICFERLHACGRCIVLGHQQRPFHSLRKWEGDRWSASGPYLTELGFVWQLGHDGLPCPSPSPEIKEKYVLGDREGWKIKLRECHCWKGEREQTATEIEAATEPAMVLQLGGEDDE
ncbi:hypothetical protein DFH06DRAFT_1324301 [Mycena polygramma]|nr:hypothetical protein DFH06DRAFT_1153316 [Mycena polygramma]KAJ7606057.1 hypothetical protein DFH06DRAFT_1150223 [Mycena polygramma]KAJ7663783.1 hypothetical protein DFH06DRAFT_1324301 [Mycena polygramma]